MEHFYIQFLDLKPDYKGLFQGLSKLELLKRWVKVSFPILVLSLGDVNMLTAEGCSDRWPPM